MNVAIPEGDFYTCSKDTEELQHTDAVSALEEYVDGLFSEPCEDVRGLLARYGTITIYVHRRVPLDIPTMARHEADRLAECAAEAWNDEYGGPDGQMDMDADPIAALATAIEPALVAFYSSGQSWNCEECANVGLSAEDVEAVLREHRPDWFKAPPAAQVATQPASEGLVRRGRRMLVPR